ncbi:MAG TPA: bifunctional UDP-sugar hydrolase/5'-nucleotidase [Kofleriaceae bacterium]|nr:bifunctional UDP-sugar hydrolase/5'-nucleotidase [Kofleriaceae bacterium]
MSQSSRLAGAALATAALAAVALAACPSSKTPPPARPAAPRKGSITLSIVGTNDLHGAVDRLPVLAGYIANLRAARAKDGGEVLLVDAGDLFQGTLASNLAEGAPVVKAYDAIGYDAAAIGNHEFDFGPEGPAVTATRPGEDPRGALRARAAEASFPFLSANILDADTGKRPAWDNVHGSIMVEKGPVVIGIIGVATESTPYTTMPANFVGLVMAKPADTIIAEAKDLRSRGAQVIVVAAHLGSKCTDLKDPNDLSSCDQDDEVFQVARALPPGLVNVIVAGHTHAAIAHRVNDIAVIESYASGRAFGRVDLRINPAGVITAVSIKRPQDLCQAPGADGEQVSGHDCQPGVYEGQQVVFDRNIEAMIEPAEAAAAKLEQEPLGITLGGPITRSYDRESAEGNLFTDLMLAARPDGDVAVTNGGGLRADMPAGRLTYGSLYEAMPFDNRFAVVKLTGAQVRKLVTNNLLGGGAILSWGGLTATASCKDGRLDVVLKDEAGTVIDDARPLTLLTSDFLASGGDGLIGRLKLPEGNVVMTDTIIRDAMASALTARGGTMEPTQEYDPSHPRLSYPGKRPVSCSSSSP